MRYKGELCRRPTAHDRYLDNKKAALGSLRQVENFKRFEIVPQTVHPIVVFSNIEPERIVHTSGPSTVKTQFEDEFVATSQDIAQNQLRQDTRIAQRILNGEELPPPVMKYAKKHAGRIIDVGRKLQGIAS